MNKGQDLYKICLIISKNNFTILLDYILLIIILISSIVLSVQDIKYKGVSITPLSVFCISCFVWYLLHRNCNLVLFCIFVFIGLIIKIFFKKEAIGKADYFIILFVSPFLYNTNLSFVLILIGIFGIITSLFIKSKNIPFILPILLSVLIVNIFKILY